jgi:hypothetical protein
MSGKKDGGRLGKQLGDTLQGLSSLMQMQFSNSGGGSSLSNDFFNLIKGIGEAKSKLVPVPPLLPISSLLLIYGECACRKKI